MEKYSFSIFPNENFMDLRLFQFGWEQCEPLHSFGPHIRNHYLFHYIISGRGVLDSQDENGVDRQYRLGPGRGFLICPGQINTYHADEKNPWKYVWLEFDGLRAADFLASAGLSVEQPIYSPWDLDMSEEVMRLMLYIAEHPEAPALHLIGYLHLFMDALIQSSANRRDAGGSRLRDFYMQEAVAHIERNYQRDLTVEELADTCGLNRNYFSKLFKEAMGCPPQEFIIRMRLSKATEMMRTEDLSIGEIAARCGYVNQMHFSRAFKKRYHVSPREWRSRNKEHTRR